MYKRQALLFSEYMENQYKDKSTLTFIQVENKIIYPLQTIICDIDVSKEVIGPLSIFLKEAEEKIQEAKPYRCIPVSYTHLDVYKRQYYRVF